MAVLLLFLFFSFAYSDTYILKSGNRIKGKLVRETDTHYPEEVDIKTLKEMPLDKMLEQLIKAYQHNPLPKEVPILAIVPFQTEDAKLQVKKGLFH